MLMIYLDKNLFLKKGVFFLIPLFFLLFTFGSDFFRFFLFIFSLSLFVVFGIYFKKYFRLNFFQVYTHEKILGLFLLLIFFSSILSTNKYYSFFGSPGNGVYSFFVIFFGFIFFLFFVRERFVYNSRYEILKFLFYSTIFIFLYKVFSSFFRFFDFFDFKTVDLLILASVNIILFLPLLSSEYFSEKLKKIIIYFLAFLFFLISLVFFKPLFFLFFVLVVFEIILLNKNYLSFVFKKRLIFSLVFLFLFGLILSSSEVNNYKIKSDNLSLFYSTRITRASLSDNFLFGSGLGSYSDIFSVYRPSALNYIQNWQQRFSNSYSFFCNLPSTVGFFASTSFLFFIIYLFFAYFKSLKIFKENKKSNAFISFLSLGLFSASLPFLITFSYFSFFLFLFSLGFSLNYLLHSGYLSGNILIVKNRNNNFLVLFLFFVFILFLVFSFSIKYLLADFYSQSKNENGFLKAESLNPNNSEYDLFLSKIYLNKAKKELSSPNKDYGLIAKNVDEAKKYAEKAISINPYSVIPYQSLGIIYRDIANYSTNGELFAINPLLKAFSLEPSNPVLATEIGKLYFLQKDLDNALKYFNIAFSLKNNYSEASLGLARVMIENNNNKKAIEVLDKLKVDNFDNSQLFFELGRAYFNINNIREAIDNFQKAVLFDPNNSNALYSLALSYEKIGDKESAFLYYKKTQDLNPGNLELLKKVNELK